MRRRVLIGVLLVVPAALTLFASPTPERTERSFAFSPTPIEKPGAPLPNPTASPRATATPPSLRLPPAQRPAAPVFSEMDATLLETTVTDPRALDRLFRTVAPLSDTDRQRVLDEIVETAALRDLARALHQDTVILDHRLHLLTLQAAEADVCDQLAAQRDFAAEVIAQLRRQSTRETTVRIWQERFDLVQARLATECTGSETENQATSDPREGTPG